MDAVLVFLVDLIEYVVVASVSSCLYGQCWCKGETGESVVDRNHPEQDLSRRLANLLNLSKKARGKRLRVTAIYGRRGKGSRSERGRSHQDEQLGPSLSCQHRPGEEHILATALKGPGTRHA